MTILNYRELKERFPVLHSQFCKFYPDTSSTKENLEENDFGNLDALIDEKIINKENYVNIWKKNVHTKIEN